LNSPETKQAAISRKVQNTPTKASEISSASFPSLPILYRQNIPHQLLTTTTIIPLGFAGFPRDPTSGKPVGLAQSFLSSPSSKEDTKRSQDTIASWKAQEAARDQHQSTDTLPVHQEKDSSNQN